MPTKSLSIKTKRMRSSPFRRTQLTRRLPFRHRGNRAGPRSRWWSPKSALVQDMVGLPVRVFRGRRGSRAGWGSHSGCQQRSDYSKRQGHGDEQARSVLPEKPRLEPSWGIESEPLVALGRATGDGSLASTRLAPRSTLAALRARRRAVHPRTRRDPRPALEGVVMK